MKKYKLSNRQQSVADLSTSYFYFERGRGATFAVVYGALKYALKNKKSAVMVCGDGMCAPKTFLNKLNEIKAGDWWFSNITIKSIVENSENVVVVLRNGSMISFASTEALRRGCSVYDLVYTDSKVVPLSVLLKQLPYVAKNYCAVESGESDDKE